MASWPTCKVVNAGAAVLAFPTKVPSHGLKEKHEGGGSFAGATSTQFKSSLHSIEHLRYGNLLWFTFKTYMGFSTSCLAVGKTCGHAAFKSSMHHGFGCEPVRRQTSQENVRKGNKAFFVLHNCYNLNNGNTHVTNKKNKVITCRLSRWWRSRQRSSQIGRPGSLSTW